MLMKGEGKFFQNLDKLYNFGYVNLLKSSAVIFQFSHIIFRAQKDFMCNFSNTVNKFIFMKFI